jgi:c-di-GMP-specific phosphodiesterase
MNERIASCAQSSVFVVLEQLADAVVGCDGERRVVLFNAAAARLWGRDRDSILGQPLAETLPDLAPALADKSQSGRSTIAIARADGRPALGELTLSSIETEGESLRLALIRDVTAEPGRHEESRLLTLVADETDRAIVITDAGHRIVYVNRAFTDMFGHQRAEVIGRRVPEVLASYGPAPDVVHRLGQRSDRADRVQEDLKVRDKANREIWIRLSLSLLRGADGKLINTVSTIANITEDKQVQMLQRDVLEAVANQLPLKKVMRLICERVEAVAPDARCSILQVGEDSKLHVLAAPNLPAGLNAAVEGFPVLPAGSCGTAAYRGEPVVTTDIDTDPLWADYKHLVLPAGLRACWSSPIKLRDGRVAGTFAFYFTERRRPSARHEQLVGICLHLSMLALERHATQEHIARLAYFDALTGLPNRARLRESLRDRLAGKGEERRLAFLFLDIDRFKDVNDTLGHGVGDRLLVETARRIATLLGPRDLLSRYGGDEFAIVLADSDTAHASDLAGRLIKQLLTPVVIEDMLLPVSVSIGICVAPTDGADEESLLKHADTAMYQAKNAGGGAFRFFSPEMNKLAQERLVLGAALREAIARGQLRLVYQPQIDCRTGALRGAEALARWTHPSFGEVRPDRFIPLAEELGLIESIGSWALGEAMSQLAAWRARGLAIPAVSVNLSAVHFRNRTLIRLIADGLERHRLEPEMLTVEITEGVIMDDDPAAVATARAIHDLGVRLSLDDFGTGYSSLSYLSRLPIDELKIDRSFMADLEEDKNAQAVATAVIRIGQSLGLAVVAEGVETEAQRLFLAALDCDMAQGFLISRALAPEAFVDWLMAYDCPDAVALPGAA